jgi:PTH1 family peptidyl-tRNA hydrolase
LSIGNICGSKVAIIKPGTLMNNSGLAVGAAARFFKITNSNIFVIHDDLDLVCGKVRVKLSGSSGGHNGIRSINGAIGKDYWRIRVGIDRPDCRSNVTPYVLSDFGGAQRLIIDAVLASIAFHLPVLLGGDADLFMNRITGNVANI